MTDHRQPDHSLDDPLLEDRIRERLSLDGIPGGWMSRAVNGHQQESAVMFLITHCRQGPDGSREPCLLLNKRSAEVLQPGDLCCPGGGVARFDRALSGLLRWPLSPLHRWPQWKQWRACHPHQGRELATLLFTGLREAWEEMRLNPLKVRFLGCLPVQHLIMFERHIYPLVGWLGDHRNLTPNWEVERIVLVPLRRLMDPRNYGRFNLSYHTSRGLARRKDQFPCFVHRGRNGREVLWGATFRIAMDFLRVVFGFRIPDLAQLPVIEKALGKEYLNGSRAQDGTKGQRERNEDF